MTKTVDATLKPGEVVVDDPAVSDEHAVIIPVGHDHILQNLQSVNGTYVNGSRVHRHILQHGDVVQFGTFYLRYLNPRASADRDLERTMLIAGLRERIDAERHSSGPLAEAVRVPPANLAGIHFPRGSFFHNVLSIARGTPEASLTTLAVGIVMITLLVVVLLISTANHRPLVGS